MDLAKAIEFGLLVQAAEAILPGNLQNIAGSTITASYGAIDTTYTVISTFYGNDLATDLNPGRINQIVSFGLILRAPNNDIVVAIRGTDGIWEWIHDAVFQTVPCPFLPGAGQVDDGFTTLYRSLRMTTDLSSTCLVDALKALPAQGPVGTLTICGHSLGGSLATLLALDVAANTPFKNPQVYTYASPRTGNPLFVSTYNAMISDSTRIAHRVDIVPKLPLPPQYGHVDTLTELNSVSFTPLPHLKAKLDLACAHHLTTYLYLLTESAGGVPLPLNPECVP